MISALPIYFCREFLNHDTGGHPENSGRLMAIMNAIDKELVIGNLEIRNPPYASKEDILLNHEESYYEFIKAEIEMLPIDIIRHLDPDTIISPGSFEAVEKGSGTARAMLENCFGPSETNMREYRAIAMPRPPGHHALYNRAMGFCLFNHIAIAARIAMNQYGLERVAIIDWDVHHGNGTEDSFYFEKEVLYISTHQYPAFPGTGLPSETGSGSGEGYNINLPLPPVSGDSEEYYCFKKVIIPVLEQFDPQILLISAGYDAHERDPLASLTFTTQCFTWMASWADKFCVEKDIPMLAFLEGGYDYVALTAGVMETMRAMRGEVDYEEPEITSVSDSVKRMVSETTRHLSDYWKLGS